MMQLRWMLSLLLLAASVEAEEAPPLFPGSPMKLWETEEIADGLYGFRYSFYRNIFIVTDAGVIATDPLNTAAAAILRAEIRKRTDLPVRYVAYSHSHWDHVSGGQIFKDEGALFVAQERCAENLRETPNPEVIAPDITFRDRADIALGGQRLSMHYFGPSHDNCIVVMRVEPSNLLFLVDVSNPPNGWTMFYNPAVSNMLRFFGGVMGLIQAERIETVIGGHMSVGMDAQTGRPEIMPATTGSVAVVAQRQAFWQTMIDGVRAELAAGTAPAKVPDTLVAQGFLADRVVGYQPQQMRILLTRITSYALTGE
jgi:glyoxylase-like metal-dependent hydrolase (beta-lactamase superfamily II)